jgi:hypothetical protein
MRERRAGETRSGTFLKNRLIRRKLGRLPDKSLDAMTDYGLNDHEIGRYFRMTTSSVRRLRRALRRRR